MRSSFAAILVALTSQHGLEARRQVEPALKYGNLAVTPECHTDMAWYVAAVCQAGPGHARKREEAIDPATLTLTRARTDMSAAKHVSASSLSVESAERRTSLTRAA